MKTIFDKETRDGLVARINKLDEKAPAQWGKMNVCQMIKHNILYEEMFLGRRQFKRVFLGYLFGKVALNDLIKDENPIKKNMPTIPGIKVTGDGGNIATERKRWIGLLEEYPQLPSEHRFVHAFFGQITREQAGQLVYKHIDHHLKQFGY